MLLNIDGLGRGFMNVLIAWAGDVSGTPERIADLCRPGGHRVGEPQFPDDNAGLAGDHNHTLSRTISWVDGRDVMFHWRLPSPRR